MTKDDVKSKVKLLGSWKIRKTVQADRELIWSVISKVEEYADINPGL